MEHEQLVTLTADIVAAHVSNNSVAVSDVAALVAKVHGALAGLHMRQEEPPQKREPMVSARASVKPDHLVCMVCGAKQKTLKRHLQTAHGMTPADYRSEFNLSHEYPMTAADYSERRRQMAKDIGLGRKPKAPKGGGDKKGRVRAKAKAKGKGAEDGASSAGE
jgi:predicted transcriptional regulator